MADQIAPLNPILLDPVYRLEGVSNTWGDWRKTATLIKHLAWRQLALRYRGSGLGFVWSLLNPVLLMGVYTFVFHFVFQATIPGVPYHVFFFTGLLAWNLVSAGTMAAAVSLLDGGSLMKKVAFPRVVLPLSAVASNAINYVVSLPIMLVFNLVSGVHPGWSILLFPVALILLMLVALSTGLLLAALVPRFRDLQHLIEVLLVAWFFMSPVVYPAAQVTRNVSSHVSLLYSLNPMVGVMQFVQSVFFGQPVMVGNLLISFCGILLLFAVGFRVFQRFSASVSEL
jgi:ABC-type polysaccharide/polyol phosphate export permease